MNRRTGRGPLHPIPGALNGQPFTQISMDLLTDLPTTDNGYDTILVVVDHGLTKTIVLIATNKGCTASTIAELLRDNVFNRFGLPQRLISEIGRASCRERV